MFIVERDLHHEVHGYDTELEKAKVVATSLIIAALRSSIVDHREADSLLMEFWHERPNKTPIIVVKSGRDSFKRIFTRVSDIAGIRREQLLADAAQGKISAVDVTRELEVLAGPECAGLDLVNCMWLNEDGLELRVELEAITPYALDIPSATSRGLIDEHDAEIISTLPVSHSANQHELVETKNGSTKLKSYTPHLSVGNLDQTGSYVAVATVLSNSHPAISRHFGPDMQ